MKFTPWFPAEIKPIRSGWYDSRISELRWWFDTKIMKWRSNSNGFVCMLQDREWRGMKK